MYKGFSVCVCVYVYTYTDIMVLHTEGISQGLSRRLHGGSGPSSVEVMFVERCSDVSRRLIGHGIQCLWNFRWPFSLVDWMQAAVLSLEC